jgi:hypothetical protein
MINTKAAKLLPIEVRLANVVLTGGGILVTILKSDKSCISNPKSEISDRTCCANVGRVQLEISDFGFEMQDSSDFKIPSLTVIRSP